MRNVFSVLLGTAVVLTGAGLGRVEAVDSARVKALFAEPPREYSSGPLWVWNDMLTEEQVVSTLRDLASQGIRQVFVHPRPGLMTPYLSAEWFRLWKAALKEAERLDMKLWIYDENSYPSGFAGGFVPEAMPQSRGQSLLVREQNEPPELSNEIIGIYRLSGDSFENVTEAVRSGKKPLAAAKRSEDGAEGRYLIAFAKPSSDAPWFGGKCYVDLLAPGVTEKFLEITMDAYAREIGSEFGKRISGVFTDEPHLGPNWDNHWTAELPDVFEKRWGYSLLDNLPSLFRPVGQWKRVRHNYHQVLLEMFIERWAKPYYSYCQNKGLELTGHYWEHEWPKCNMVPDNMAMSAWQQRPGIDCLFNQYQEGVHSQFGNIRAALELSSVANQLARRRTLCEAYGGSGWDMRFEDMKRIGDWLYVLGVNTLNEHLSHISIRGARKTDYPPSFSYHQPWWEAYHVLENYFACLSAALSQGRQINEILVIEPTTTAWTYQPDPNHKEHLEKIGEQFQQMVTGLAKAQVEFDIGCEDIIAREGTVEGTKLKIGQRRYSTVVLSPMMENVNAKTMELLEAYTKAGGLVFCCGAAPGYIDGSASQRGKKLSQNHGYRQVEATALAAMLRERTDGGFTIRADEGSKGILLHHRRRLDDGELVFITNTSIESQCSGTIECRAGSIERWDPQTGLIDGFTFEAGKDGIRANFNLPACGSLLLFLSKNPGKTDPPASSASRAIPAVGAMKVRRLESNVLTLDYMDVTAGGETKEHIYFYQACQFAFEKNGMNGNPWDGAVQFRDELIRKKFGPQSGVEATYRFTIEEKVPAPLFIVIERPDLYSITCNEKPVSDDKGSWWLDKSFGKIDITSAAKVGENKVTIKASPFTMYHELAAAYVLGDFSLKAIDKGFTVVHDVVLVPGKWNEQGHPFYSATVSYNQSFDIPEMSGKYCVRLAGWYGSVAKVVVNGACAGYIWHQPWECDVTEHIRKGKNEIEVIVTGTLKNTLGPHHAKPPPGFADPKSFRKTPPSGPPAGKEYDTIAYGLFEPFELIATEGRLRQAGRAFKHSPKDNDPYKGPRPLAVLLEENPWLHVINSDTPTVVLYEDGTLIYLEFQNKCPPIYRKKVLESDVLSKVTKQIGPSDEFRRLKKGYALTPNVTDQPTLHVYLSDGDISRRVSVYGVSQEQIVSKNYEDLVGSKSSGEWFPKEFYRVCKELSLLRYDDAEKWVPRFIEIMLQDSDPNDSTISWPQAWPDLSDPLTKRSPSGQLYLLYMPGSKMEEVLEFFNKTGGRTSINGNNYYAGGVRPVFQSEPIWRKCFFTH